MPNLPHLKMRVAGRPVVMPTGPDGQPVRLTFLQRPSSVQPGRTKVALAGPIAGHGVKFAEFRIEAN